MRIAAAVCWYDEPAEHLHRLVASVSPLVDCIVAYDGPWQGFPHDSPCSPTEQHDALHSAIDGAGIPDALMASSAAAWPSQAEKRTALYQAAAERADWVLVIDADEQLASPLTPTEIRRRIAMIDRRYSPDAINVRVATPGIGKGGPQAAQAPGGVRYQPRLLRSDAFLECGPHSHRTLTNERAIIQCEHPTDAAIHDDKIAGRSVTLSGVSIVNRTHDRSAERIAAKRAYAEARSQRGID